MPQVRKDAVRERIVGAALAAFSRDGWAGATMAAIAGAAGVSTGNVYRYFPTKEALLDAVLGDELVARLQGLLRRRVAALGGVADVAALAEGAPFHAVGEELLRLSIEHRQQVLLLLGGAAGTRYEPVAGEVVETLKSLAVEHFRALAPGLAVTPTMAFLLDRIYRAWLRTLLDLLGTYETEADIRAAVAEYLRYHLTGLRALFEGAQRASREPDGARAVGTGAESGAGGRGVERGNGLGGGGEEP
jgi:AcrR family transcriptional regulator